MCIKSINSHPKLKHTSLEETTLYYKGDISLLEKPLISIVGSRKPNTYAKEYTYKIASALKDAGFYIVSGGAIGVDSIAHKAATPSKTILIAATGLDQYYPKINTSLIKQIEKEGLVLSQFPQNTPSFRYNFPLRNELIVALSDILIVTYADENSGTTHSINYAKKLQKKIFTLPHRINESKGTNKLLANQEAKAIYDIEEFVYQLSGKKTQPHHDPFLEFCKTNPPYDVALKKYGSQLFEYELLGKISIKNARVFINP